MPDELPFASVVVPASNEEERIGPCVDSLLRLDYPRERFEVIVVENGSADGTAGVLDRYGDQVQILQLARATRAGAHNAGLAAASGEVVAFIDGDCVADPGWLRAMVTPLARGDRVVVAGDVLAPPEAGWIERFCDRIHDQRAAVGFDPPYASTASCAMPLDELREAGGFDERLKFNGDIDVSFRLHAKGWAFVHQPDAVVRHPGVTSLRRLFGVGHRHGHYAIQSWHKHAAALRRAGNSRWSFYLYRPAAGAALRLLRSPSRDHLCDLVFKAGTAAGRLTGVVRFRSLPS